MSFYQKVMKSRACWITNELFRMTVLVYFPYHGSINERCFQLSFHEHFSQFRHIGNIIKQCHGDRILWIKLKYLINFHIRRKISRSGTNKCRYSLSLLVGRHFDFNCFESAVLHFSGYYHDDVMVKNMAADLNVEEFLVLPIKKRLTPLYKAGFCLT